MRLRTKITGTYIAVALGSIALVAVIGTWQINNFLDRRTADVLASQVAVVSDLVGEGYLTFDSTADDEHLRSVARNLGIRISLIRKDGVVLFDSDVARDSLAHVENHLGRPEVRLARESETGTDRRRSATVGSEFLYAARRLRAPGFPAIDSGYVRAALNVTELNVLDTHVATIMGLIGILTLGVVAYVSSRVSNRITEPILTIANAAAAIRGGEYGRRADVVGGDEIGALAKAINGMAEKLSNDIVRLEKLEHVRSEFLGNVSHELRTPIFSLQGFLETLLDGAIDDPAVNREFLEKAHRHAQRLNALLNDLIEISRIESGEMQMSFRYFSIGEFLENMRDEMLPAAERKGVALLLAPGMISGEKAYGDRERLKQVMVNLIDNAIKYTEAGGSVTLSAMRDGDVVIVRVADTGIGIAEEHHARVFERFYRVDRDRSRDAGGTGLGLAIVKHIVEAHGGRIDLASAPGKGSTFSFSLKR